MLGVRGRERGGRETREGGQGGARAKSPIRPPTLRNITSSNVERKFLNASHTRRSMTSHMT